MVVLDRRLAAELGVGVGDWVSFDHGPKGESVWRIVGLQSSPGAVGLAQSVMMPRETLAHELNCVGKANTVWVQAANLNRDSEINLARTLTDHYEANNIQVSLRTLFDANTARRTAESNLEQLGLIISLLGAMALVTAIVGGVALSGVLSINVMERRREIGVMRAIGATSSKIAALFVGEGLILALLSWLIALPVSVPASQLMTQTLAEVINYDVIYVYSEAGAWYWLAIVLALSILASWLPARSATRISVRESLSYN